MRQRVKLAQAFFSDTPVLLLDEPCTNLDEAGVQQYLDWIAEYTNDRTVIVASNDTREYSFCEHRMLMSNYQ
jgi:ABC-type multidrug transport system ATPase subunit